MRICLAYEKEYTFFSNLKIPKYRTFTYVCMYVHNEGYVWTAFSIIQP